MAAVPRSWVSLRSLAAVALVLAIGGLFAWRELGAESGPSSILAAGEEALQVEIGEPVPDFRLDTPDGSELRLSDFRGQAVVLNFWATWCGPCRAEMPELQAIHDQYSGPGTLTVLGIDELEPADSVTGFAEELALTFPIALDRDGEVAERYGLLGLPGTFFIDAAGVLRARVLGQLHGELLADGLASIVSDAVAAP